MGLEDAVGLHQLKNVHALHGANHIFIVVATIKVMKGDASCLTAKLVPQLQYQHGIKSAFRMGARPMPSCSTSWFSSGRWPGS